MGWNGFRSPSTVGIMKRSQLALVAAIIFAIVCLVNLYVGLTSGWSGWTIAAFVLCGLAAGANFWSYTKLRDQA